jgi:hypothetical protein
MTGLGPIGNANHKKPQRGTFLFVVLRILRSTLEPRPLLCALLFASTLPAQTDPSLHWRTLKTPHFQVSFSPGLEETARRAAGSAERAYDALSKELHPPRGPISIVVADNFDVSNGYATPTPSNRIVIFARPTIDAGALRFVDDWVDLVVVHELTHIFHLDRSRGLLGFGQKIFGRNPFLFPHAYTPSWLAEGIAVYYESKLTGAGRLYGTDFDAIIRAHELGGRPPKLNALSGSSPIYPLGSIAYTYGSPLVEQMMAKGRPDGMRAFIDGYAAWLIPFMLNTNSERAFGISFDSAYRVWTDSVHREAQRVERRMRPANSIVSDGWFASRPRWLNDSTIYWASADAKSVPSLKQVSATGGPVKVLSDLNSTDVNEILPNGVRVFAQDEYVDPYTQRSDLFLKQSGSVRRLTHGARLTHPDARLCEDSPGSSDICIVAVQVSAGAAGLVHVRVYGDKVDIRTLTPPSADELLTDPRWSHDGKRIAVARWSRGGMARIDVLDEGGKVVLQSLGASRSVTTSPSWGLGDTTIYFTSDRSGRSAIYRASVASGTVVRVADAPTGLYENEVSPDGKRLATFQLWADGYDLTVVDANPARPTPVAADAGLGTSRGTPIARSDVAAGSYSAWRSVLPTYWIPAIEEGARGGYEYGFSTGGSDVIGRHNWGFRGLVDTESGEPNWNANYSFAGLGVPVAHLGASEFWDHFTLGDSTGKPIGDLNRRRIFGDAALTFSRPRVRSAVAFSVGGSYEWRNDETEPASLINQLDPAFRRTRTYPSYFASASFANARHPSLALGPQDGISLGATVRQRWRSGAADATRATSLSGALQAYRSFDFGGRARHLLAARFAAATTDVTSSTDFSAGGNSGGVIQVAPGVTFGEGRRSYFVRGFEGGAQHGSRAMGASAEYRFPIAFPARGLWKFPLFFQRVSGVVFTDAATAWCPEKSSTSPICARVTPMTWMSSAGAELHLDMAMQYDATYRFRAGFAVPTAGRSYTSSTGTIYIAVGLPF